MSVSVAESPSPVKLESVNFNFMFQLWNIWNAVLKNLNTDQEFLDEFNKAEQTLAELIGPGRVLPSEEEFFKNSNLQSDSSGDGSGDVGFVHELKNCCSILNLSGYDSLSKLIQSVEEPLKTDGETLAIENPVPDVFFIQ